MGIFSSLKKDQKEAVCLLQIGTFLEYFDLMLYVHMGVLLNELFFPTADPHTTALFAALAFCSTYVMRPLGALVFGFIGDHVGRKTTVIFTTLMMSFSCLLMAHLPPYSQIGITASWLVTICRMVQGMSSLGERVGAEIYLTEMIKPPLQYPLVSLLTVSAVIGSMVALVLASVATTSGLNWRMGFLFGAVIAFVGTIARKRLRETPDFVDMKRRKKNVIRKAEEEGLTRAADLFKRGHAIENERVQKKTVVAYFFTQSAWPVFFYFSFIFCGGILKNQFHYTPEQIIHHNLIISAVHFVSCLYVVFLSRKVFPLKIVRIRTLLFLPFLLLTPILLNEGNLIALFVAQVMAVSLAPASTPANAVFYVHFPVFRRFTYTSFIYALSRAFASVVTSFGLVYLTYFFGYWGLMMIMGPVTLGFAWGIRHFETLHRLKQGLSEESRILTMQQKNECSLV